MKTQLITIQTLGGPKKKLMPVVGEIIEFDRDVIHADTKTASIFPERWPLIKKGTKVKVVGHMENLYGVFVKVEHNDSCYDVEDYKIVGLFQ